MYVPSRASQSTILFVPSSAAMSIARSDRSIAYFRHEALLEV